MERLYEHCGEEETREHVVLECGGYEERQEELRMNVRKEKKEWTTEMVFQHQEFHPRFYNLFMQLIVPPPFYRLLWTPPMPCPC